MRTQAPVRCVCSALGSSVRMLHNCFTVSLLLTAMTQWCTGRHCKLWEWLLHNVPTWMLFRVCKTIASCTDPEAKVMQASEDTGEIEKAQMLSWPMQNKRGMRLSRNTFVSLMTRLHEKSRLTLDIEQSRIDHSHLEVVVLRHFLLHRHDAEFIGLNIVMYGSAAGGVEPPNAAELISMQYHIDMDNDSCLPSAEIH